MSEFIGGVGGNPNSLLNGRKSVGDRSLEGQIGCYVTVERSLF